MNDPFTNICYNIKDAYLISRAFAIASLLAVALRTRQEAENARDTPKTEVKHWTEDVKEIKDKIIEIIFIVVELCIIGKL